MSSDSDSEYMPSERIPQSSSHPPPPISRPPRKKSKASKDPEPEPSRAPRSARTPQTSATGASSQTPSTPQIDPRLQSWFTSPAQIQKFREKFANREVVKGMSLDWTFFTRERFSFPEDLEHAGLTHFLTIRERSYPELVKVFYSTFVYNPQTGIARAQVKGKNIKITPTIWTQLTGLSWDGDLLEPDKTPEGVDFFEPARQLVCHVKARLRSNKSSIPAGFLTTEARVLHFAITKILAARQSNYAKVTFDDLFCLWAILERKSVNWSHFILTRMSRATICPEKKSPPSLPYTMIITRILQYFGVDLLGEDFETTTDDHHKLGEYVLTHSQINKHRGVWMIDRVNEDSNKSLRDHPPAVSDDDEEAAPADIASLQEQIQLLSV